MALREVLAEPSGSGSRVGWSSIGRLLDVSLGMFMRWLAVAAALPLLSGCGASASDPGGQPGVGCKAPEIVGHRGAPHLAPENTLPAVRAAAESGAGWVETDVRTSSDGVPVLFHDATVDDLTNGSGAVGELTAEQLARLRVDTGRGDPAPIPTLVEGLAVLGEYPEVKLLLEIKGTQTPEELRLILDQLDQSDMMDRTTIQSFDETALAQVKQMTPVLPTAILRMRLDSNPAQIATMYSAYHPRAGPLLSRPEVVKQLHAAGALVTVWTVDDPAIWEQLAEVGVDGVVTNVPGEAAAWVAAYCRRQQPA